MSAFVRTPDLSPDTSRHVRVVLDKNSPGPSERLSLFDHLVSRAEQSWWKGEAEHLGGLEIEDELELCWLHDGHFCGVCALENWPMYSPAWRYIQLMLGP